MSLKSELLGFATDNGFSGSGALSVALVVTDHAKACLPLDPDQMLAPKKGQVKGLGKAAVQAILKRHGIERVLSEEGGRTSRGSIDKMRIYVGFLNALHAENGGLDLAEVEKFWVEQVLGYFAGKPFKFRVDAALSVRAAVSDVLGQARVRQREMVGSRSEGIMLQHLIGAKFAGITKGQIEHHSASEADRAEGRAGDFVWGDMAIHVTTSPGEALLRKCSENLGAGLRPMIVTLCQKTAVAYGLAETLEIADRVDIFGAEEFLAGNIHEAAVFEGDSRRIKTAELVERYNELIDRYERDPSLKIEIVGA